MRFTLSPIFEQLTEYCWLTAALALPVVCNPWGADIFELPKYLTLLTLAALLGTFSLLHPLAAGPRRLPPDLPLLWAILGCFMAAMGATLLSDSLQDSLVGVPGRHQGLLTMVGYLVLMLSAALYMQSLDQVERFLRILVWTSAPLCLFGLLQFFHLNPFDWVTDSTSPMMATLGRSNFFASYLALLVPLSLVLLKRTKQRLPLALLLAAQSVCLLLSHVRSSWIALGTAALTWLLLCRIKPSGCRALPYLPLLLAASATAWMLTGFLAVPLDLQPPAGFVPVSETILNQGGSMAARLTIWQRSVDLILERPWLGYGLDTMETVFTRAFPPELVYYQGRHVMVDRAHNLWLDLGMSSGLLGIGAVTALLILAGLRIDGYLRTTGDPEQRLIRIGLAAALTGHLADLQFSFDQTANAALFWLLLGVAMAATRIPPDARREEGGLRPSRLASGLLWLLLFSVIFTVWPLHVLRADRMYAVAMQTERPLAERIRIMEQAVRLQPRQTDYLLDLAMLYGAAGNLTGAEQRLHSAWRLRPNDPWIKLLSGHLYARHGDFFPEYLAKAEQAYRQAVALAPDISSFHTVLATVLVRRGRLFAALDELKEAVRLDETDPVAHGQLARLYELLGNREQAREARRQAKHWARHERNKPRP